MARRRKPSKKGEVLVAVMNDPAAWKIAREEGWYRVPIVKATPVYRYTLGPLKL